MNRKKPKKPKALTHWKNAPPEARSAHARMMGQLRWKDVPVEDRKQQMSELGQLGLGIKRPHQGKDHCPCGAMTLKRAQTRAGKDGKGWGHKPKCRFYKPEPVNRVIKRRNMGPRQENAA
jgi:hypothetical protein